MITFLKQTYGAVNVVGVIFFGWLLLEASYDVFIKKKPYQDSLANFVIFGVGMLLEKVFYGVLIYLGLSFFQQLALFQIPNTAWSFMAAVFLSDFIYYWLHRWEHEIRVLWTMHSVHHSSEEFNLTTSLRVSWLSNIYQWLFYMPLVLLGFSLEATLVALSVNQIYGVWTHSGRIGKLGWIEHIFVTPSNHRAHHGSNSQYIDKNYGGIFIFWDKLFGSFEPEVEEVRYGITEPIETYNPIKINFDGLRQMIQDIRSAKSKKEMWKYIFGAPGWSPIQPITGSECTGQASLQESELS